MSHDYAFEMFDKLGVLGVMSEEQVKTYKRHVENLIEEEEEMNNSSEKE